MIQQLALIGADGEIAPCSRKSSRRPKGKLYEIREVDAAMEFIRTLVTERLAQINGETDRGLTHDFDHDKDILANIIGSARYGDLPPDARSFVSRCAAYKRHHPRKSFTAIAREQYALLKHQADALYDSIIAIACDYERKLAQEKEARDRRWALMKRMSHL